MPQLRVTTRSVEEAPVADGARTGALRTSRSMYRGKLMVRDRARDWRAGATRTRHARGAPRRRQCRWRSVCRYKWEGSREAAVRIREALRVRLSPCEYMGDGARTRSSRGIGGRGSAPAAHRARRRRRDGAAREGSARRTPASSAELDGGRRQQMARACTHTALDDFAEDHGHQSRYSSLYMASGRRSADEPTSRTRCTAGRLPASVRRSSRRTPRNLGLCSSQRSTFPPPGRRRDLACARGRAGEADGARLVAWQAAISAASALGAAEPEYDLEAEVAALRADVRTWQSRGERTYDGGESLQ